MHRIFAGSLIAISPLAFSATEFADTLPVELARSLISGPTGYTARFYQDLPEDFPFTDFPPDYRLVGSADQGFGHTAVLAVDEPTADAHARMNSLLEAAGWHPLTPGRLPSSRNGGFVSSQTSPLTTPSMFCHENVEGAFQVVEVNLAGGGTFLSLMHRPSLSLSGQPSPSCAEQLEQAEFQQRGGFGGFAGDPANSLPSYVPRLELPETEEAGRPMNLAGVRDGGGSPIHDWQISSQLSTNWELSELLEHFAPQLQAQDWTLEGSGTAGLVATSSWTRNMENGTPMLGILSIIETSDERFELRFRLLRKAR